MKRRTFATKENSNQKVRIWRFALEQILNDTKGYLVPSFKHDHSVGGGDLVTKSCPTLETPWTVPARLLCPWGFSRQEYWSGLPFPSPGHLPNPRFEPASPTLAGRFFTTEPPGKPILVSSLIHICWITERCAEKEWVESCVIEISKDGHIHWPQGKKGSTFKRKDETQTSHVGRDVSTNKEGGLALLVPRFY